MSRDEDDARKRGRAKGAAVANAARRARVTRIRGGVVERLCARCWEWKPADRQHFHAKGDGIQPYCKPCASEAATEWRRANRPARGDQRHHARPPVTDLSPRQKDVVIAVLREGTNKEAAHALGISEQTVKNHLTEVYRRLDKPGLNEVVWTLWVGPAFERDGFPAVTIA